MQTVIGGSYSPGAALPAGMTEEDLARKNLREANQVNALKFDSGSGQATAAFDSGGRSTGGVQTPAQSAGTGLLGSAIGRGALGAATGYATGILAGTQKPQARNGEVGGTTYQPSTLPDKTGASSTSNTSSTSSTSSTPQQLGLPASWKITPDQTVEGRIGALTDPNNPFIQQARSRADGRSNERGLLNSSMALTAADSAAYDAAMPIAQADAANASKIAGYNTDQQNQFALANMSNATNRYGIDTTSSTQRYVSDQNAATQIAIKKLDQTQQTMLAELANKNQALLQNSQVASSAYGTYAQTLYNNSVNKDMPPEARYQADQNAFNLYQQQISLASNLLNVPDVSNLLNFTTVNPNAPLPVNPTKPVPDNQVSQPTQTPVKPGILRYSEDANRF